MILLRGDNLLHLKGNMRFFPGSYICSYHVTIGLVSVLAMGDGPLPSECQDQGNWDQRECGLKVQTETLYQCTFFMAYRYFVLKNTEHLLTEPYEQALISAVGLQE